MSWLRISDNFLEHPKFEPLNERAVFIWLKALSHCYQHPTTNGFVSNRILAKIKCSQSTRSALVSPPTGYDHGLWEEVVDPDSGASQGILIHDYAAYRPTVDRSSMTSIGRAGGIASGESRRAKSEKIVAKSTELHASPKRDASSVDVNEHEASSEAPSHPIPSHPIPSQPDPTQEEKKEDLSRTAPGGFRLEAPKSSPKQAEPAKPPTGDHAKVMAHYAETYTAMFGQKPVIDAADGQWVKRALKNIGLESTLSSIDAWFTDDFNSKKRPSLRQIDLNVAVALAASRSAHAESETRMRTIDPTVNTPSRPLWETRPDLFPPMGTDASPSTGIRKVAEKIPGPPDEDDQDTFDNLLRSSK